LITKVSTPIVSIIVPLFNEENRLRALCRALLAQSYKPLEIILVDNASTDSTFSLANELACGQIKVVQELEFQNADAARNKGIEVAHGDILAFTDGDCLPTPNWVKAAIDQFNYGKADLIAGQISFSFRKQPSCGEFYDAVTFLQHSTSVSERGVAFTANLFVRKKVILSLGGFSVDTVWNGDFMFTRHAVQSGFSLEYCKEAIVIHPARKSQDVFKKVWRISWGKGFLATSDESSIGSSEQAGAKAFFFEPKPHIRHLNPGQLLKSLNKKGILISKTEALGTFFVAWTVGLIGLLGFLTGRIARMRQRRDQRASLKQSR